MSNNNGMSSQIELTREGLEDLKAELRKYKEERLPKIIERVANAREQGDLSENADYQSAKDEQEMIQSRIDELESAIARAKVVEADSKKANTVGMGSVVSVLIKGRGKKAFDYKIVGEFESNPEEGRISSVSPLGRALIGKKKGDEVTVTAPAGELNYVIESVK